jgi:hypothetical protein
MTGTLFVTSFINPPYLLALPIKSSASFNSLAEYSTPQISTISSTGSGVAGSTTVASQVNVWEYLKLICVFLWLSKPASLSHHVTP